MAHRNRWFTKLKNGWIFPWRTVGHNQRVLLSSLLTPTVHTHPMYLSYKVAKLPKVLTRLEVFGKWPEHCARQARS